MSLLFMISSILWQINQSLMLMDYVEYQISSACWLLTDTVSLMICAFPFTKFSFFMKQKPQNFYLCTKSRRFRRIFWLNNETVIPLMIAMICQKYFYKSLEVCLTKIWVLSLTLVLAPIKMNVEVHPELRPSTTHCSCRIFF